MQTGGRLKWLIAKHQVHLAVSSFVGVLIVGAAFLALSPIKNSLSIPAVTVGEEASIVDDWLVIGPFEAPRGTNPLDTDFLAWHGVPEELCSVNMLGAVLSSLPTKRPDSGGPFVSTAQYLEFVDFPKLFGRSYESVDKMPPAAAYVCCVLNSEKANPAYLLLGSDDGAKVWLNGEALYVSKGGRALRTYNDTIKLPLKSGPNFLLIKVEDYGIYWGVAARIEPTVESAAKTILSRQRLLDSSDLLKSVFVSAAEPLRLKIAGGPKDFSGTVTIAKWNGELVDRVELESQSGAWNPNDAQASGLYKASIEIGGEVYSQPFCIGDPSRLLSDFVKLGQKCSAESDDIRRNLGALEARATVLTAPDNLNPSDQEWQRKVMFVIREYHDILTQFQSNQDPFANVAGLHLRGFNSRIDDQPQYYRVFVPEGAPAKSGWPLIVMLPTSTSTDRPFIESPFIAAHYEAERISALAQKYGVAIVWSGFRVRPYGHPCEFTHLDEVLEAVGRDYHIDKERVTLAGACSGGWLGLMAAVRWPNRFAGMAVLNPYFRRSQNTVDDEGQYAAYPAYQRWIKHNDPFDSFFKECRLPVNIMHDGAEPGHGPIESSLEFISKARSTKYPAELNVLPQTEGQHFAAWEKVIAWLTRQRCQRYSVQRNEKYFTGHEGVLTVSQFFADRFVVVAGTAGSTAELTAQQVLLNAFVKSWRATHKAECRVINDTELSEQEEQSSNLVLLGNSRINLVWKQLSASLPYELGQDHITAGQKRWYGNGLSLQATVPHPEVRGRSLVLIGAADLARARFGTLDLSVHGWFEYAVWKPQGRSAQLLAAANLVPATRPR